MWPTIAAAPVSAISAVPAGQHVGDRHGGYPLRHVQRHDDDAAPGAGGTQHVRRPDVAAAGNAHVDPPPAREQVGERHRAGQVPEEDREHQLNGTRSSGS